MPIAIDLDRPGSSPEEATRNYKELKSRVDAQYIKDVKNLAYAGKRVPQDDIDTMTELTKKDGRIKDDNNPMRDKDGNLRNPYDPGHHATASASATPTPSHTPAAAPVPTPTPSPSASPTPSPTPYPIHGPDDVKAYFKKYPDPKNRPPIVTSKGRIMTLSD